MAVLEALAVIMLVSLAANGEHDKDLLGLTEWDASMSARPWTDTGNEDPRKHSVARLPVDMKK